MPQCWAELIASRLHKRECAGQIASIKQACDEGCSKKDFVECSKCYELAVDRLRMRYCASDSQEWFTDRKAFVQELEGLFAEVKRRKRSLQSVEARIEAEKEAWYRLMLRRHPDFLALAEQGSRSSELRKMLDDPDTSRQNIVDRVWEGFGKSHNWESDVDSFAEKVSAVGSDSAARKEVYSNGIFVDTVKGGADKYFAEYEHHEDISSPDTLLEVVIGKVADDIRQSRSSQPERDNHQKRLDDLRRAKTAFEQNKVRAKNRARNAPVAGEVLYELPPCLVCQKAVDTTKVLSCTVCQMVTQIGGDGNLTVYCSEECYEKGHVSFALDFLRCSCLHWFRPSMWRRTMTVKRGRIAGSSSMKTLTWTMASHRLWHVRRVSMRRRLPYTAHQSAQLRTCRATWEKLIKGLT